MNGSLIAKLNNVNIYLINDKNINFYLSIPNTNINKTNIAINIVTDPNNYNINSIYNKLDNNNICTVTPIINQNILLRIKDYNEEQFINMDKIISYLINNAYKILSNNYNIDSKIILIKNNEYQLFEEWFISRYKTRVEYNIDDSNMISDVTTTIPTINNEPSEINVENNNESSEINVENNNKLDDIKADNSIENTPTGFVSYVLLGVVVAVASLVLLYMLI